MVELIYTILEGGGGGRVVYKYSTWFIRHVCTGASSRCPQSYRGYLTTQRERIFVSLVMKEEEEGEINTRLHQDYYGERLHLCFSCTVVLV